MAKALTDALGLVVLALMRSLGSLRSPVVWVYLLAPAAVSFFLWMGLAIWGVGAIVDWLLANPPMTLLASWGLIWLAHVLAWMGGWMAVFAAAYLTTALLAAILVLPLMLRHLARGEYADVAPMGTDSVTASTVNSLWAAVLFIAAWLLTLPLWLIPGLALLVPLLLMAWFNRRTFAYDALAQHATAAEWARLRQSEGRALFLLGLVMAVLAHVPFLGLLVPALAALSYVHLGLEGLRRLRGEAVLVGEAVRIDQ
jgi:hypothetical protein